MQTKTMMEVEWVLVSSTDLKMDVLEMEISLTSTRSTNLLMKCAGKFLTLVFYLITFLAKIPLLQLLVHALALAAALVAHAMVKVFSRVRKTFIKEVTLLIPLLPLQLSLQPLQLSLQPLPQTEETKKTNQRIVMERLKTNLKPKMNLRPKISLKSKTNLNPKTIPKMKVSRKMTRNLRMKMKFPSL